MTTKHLSVIIAFLESKVNEELYAILPMGIVLFKERLRVSSGSQVHARLLNSLYGLKQVTINWFETLDNFLSSIGL